MRFLRITCECIDSYDVRFRSSQLVHQMTETAIFGVDVVEDVLADDDVNRLVLHQPDLTFSTHLYTSTGEINGRLLDFYSSYMFDVGKRRLLSLRQNGLVINTVFARE